MWAIRSCKTSVRIYHTKQYHISKDSEFQSHWFQNLKSNIIHNLAENEFPTTWTVTEKRADRQTLQGYEVALLGTAPSKKPLERRNRTFPQETASVWVYETLQNDILTAGGGVQFAWRRFTTHLIQSNDPVVTLQDGRCCGMLMRSLLQPIITRILLNVFLRRRHEEILHNTHHTMIQIVK